MDGVSLVEREAVCIVASIVLLGRFLGGVPWQDESVQYDSEGVAVTVCCVLVDTTRSPINNDEIRYLLRVNYQSTLLLVVFVDVSHCWLYVVVDVSFCRNTQKQS